MITVARIREHWVAVEQAFASSYGIVDLFGTFSGHPVGYRKFMVLLGGFPPLVTPAGVVSHPIYLSLLPETAAAGVGTAASPAGRDPHDMTPRELLDLAQGRDPNRFTRTISFDQFVGEYKAGQW